MTRRYVVPGRVELVGKHVDYGGGRSLTCAVEFAVRATARPIGARVLRVRQRGVRDLVEVPIGPEAVPTRARWSTYVAAVARRLARDFPGSTGGAEVHLVSRLPPAAGLSSSTALTITLVRAAADATGVTAHPLFQEHAGTPITFGEYVAAVETGAPYGPFAGDDGVGVRGGAQDHVAIMCAREEMVGQFSYIPAREEGWAPWPADCALMIGVSGVRASKTGNAQAAYNRAADAVRWLVRAWNGTTYRNDATLADALASAPDAGERLRVIAGAANGAPVSGEYMTRRLDQFREECDVIVPGVADAFRAGDLARVGVLVDRSQAMAEHALENQVPQTIHLARTARELGADAASAFGAGFGGAVWAMVARDRADAFAEAWEESYAGAFAREAPRARFLRTRPGAPAGSESASD
ncbi:MAG: galactokinase [Gemmatimonadetes bacterium]|nr:galactokinase [Gemmatimonadota bacterium]